MIYWIYTHRTLSALLGGLLWLVVWGLTALLAGWLS
jgi:hypothetical protein